MPREYEFSSASVVLLGTLNPSIFSPAWFSRYNLLTDEEAAAATVQLIHPEIAHFDTGWLTLRVEQQRFQALTRQSPIQVKDLVLKTFTDYLIHTPIHSLGINREFQYKLTSPELRMKLGRSMAPLAPWGKFGGDIEKCPEDNPGGMMVLTMRLPIREGRPNGWRQVTISPINLSGRRTSVKFGINDHYEINDKLNVVGCEEIMTLLDTNFERSVAISEEIVDEILTKVEG